MTTEEERCAEAKKFSQIHAAFQAGDLEALRAAVDDPASVPNGPMPATIGNCLVYAVYHSPLAFIRTLLDIGADPNAPVDDGFPPLIAALSCARAARGSTARTDVDEIIRLLLASGADPNRRGINDYTPLHMAVAERQGYAIHLLLDAGADSSLRTRIDDCETPLEMAQAAGLPGLAAMLAPGAAARRRLRSGLTLLADIPGTGEPVRRQHRYRMRLRMWLNRGEPVRWEAPWGSNIEIARLDDDGATLTTDVRIDRRSLINGLFYSVDGMRVGGTRRVEIAPHLAYGDRGLTGVIPAGAVLIAEITILPLPAAS